MCYRRLGSTIIYIMLHHYSIYTPPPFLVVTIVVSVIFGVISCLMICITLSVLIICFLRLKKKAVSHVFIENIIMVDSYGGLINQIIDKYFSLYFIHHINVPCQSVIILSLYVCWEDVKSVQAYISDRSALVLSFESCLA